MSDDESDEFIDAMEKKSFSQALQIIDRVMRFSQHHGNEELDQSLLNVTEKL